jgi:N,N-dimethylformamidase beta subunit-like protein/uncharacterized protein DUF4082/Big-like domain-containing protein
MTPRIPLRGISGLCALTVAGLLVLAALTLGESRAATLPATPTGLTAIALDGKVSLSWQPSANAAGYIVYRGVTLSELTPITPAGHADTKFVDEAAVNGQAYYYSVRATSADGQSSLASQRALATPLARSCSSGNAVVVENCFPGTTNWRTTRGHHVGEDGLGGFASASSIQAGESVNLSVEIAVGAQYRVEIYRTGSYGGAQGRLVSVIPRLFGREQEPPCYREYDTSGVVDCSNRSVTAVISTSKDWPSGVYILKLVRTSNGLSNEVLLVVRDDESTSDVVFHVPTSTYQAYNNFLDKSLYDAWSVEPNTVAGTPRAVKVGFDRPYAQPEIGPRAHDWYTRTDVAAVSWLERQGYDVSYIASEDLNERGSLVQNHRVFISGSHDEYWSREMFDAALAARASGTSLIFLGANAAYWKVRFVPGALSGKANRAMVAYKTVQSGPPDPSGISTSTWRDPAGPNQPENELIGQMYVGENIAESFPLRVSAAEGRSRFWRYTSLAGLAPGSSASVGTALVGWEWDARAANGREPDGVSTLASTPVSGQLIQQNGRFQTNGTTTANTTLYRAPSGALVFATGTNNWWRGLALNVDGAGEPDTRIQQATTNVLDDMGVRPTTLSAGLRLDPVGPPIVTSAVPADGSTSAQPNAPVTVGFDRQLDPASVGPDDLTLSAPDGTPVRGDVSLDGTGTTLILRPHETLDPFSSYTAHVGTALDSWSGEHPAAGASWQFATGVGTPPVPVERTPVADATSVATDLQVRAKLDRRLDPVTVTSDSFTVRPAAGGQVVAANVSYDDATRTVTLVPAARLAQNLRYTAELSASIRARDGTAMAAPASWSFTTGTNLQVTGRTPAPLAGGISPSAVVRVSFSRPVDGGTVDNSHVRLLRPGGQTVPAQVAYDAATRTATLVPAQPLELMSAYDVVVDDSIRASDGAPLDGVRWSFSTAITPPPAPVPVAFSPSAAAAGVMNDARVRVTFDRALDPATVTPQTFTLAPAGGAPVTATVAYDQVNQRATLTPLASLAVGTHYTAALDTGIRSAAGTPLASVVSWSFITARCPCNLMAATSPAETGIPVQDYRPGPGPFSYELGTRLTVDEPSDLVALRFYKDPHETGSHIGRVWNDAGAEIARAVFEGESASGWQRQALPTPLRIEPGRTYTVSVGLNSFYSKTTQGLATPLASGPLRTPSDNRNGVYAPTAGVFPTESWRSTNYFVDAVATLPVSPRRTPEIVSTTPSAGSTGIAVSAPIAATFSVPLDVSTVHAGSFTLADSGGQPVAASVSYDDESQTALLRPSAPLEPGRGYTARLDPMIRSDDETPLSSAMVWTFTTVPPDPPFVANFSPSAAAAGVSPLSDISVRFSQPIDPATLTGAFTLTAPDGASVAATVDYDAATRTATLSPASVLAASSHYTAGVSREVLGTAGVPLGQSAGWSFTTSPCPCRLFDDNTPPPAATGLDTRNGRGGPGPFALELGVKIGVAQPARLEAIRFLKDAGEQGAHIGRLWTTNGALVAEVPFEGEGGPGWQQQTLATPVALVPGQTYVVSVTFNSAFGMLRDGLAAPLGKGPLRSVADGQNGVYSEGAGSFPRESWASSNYYVDAVVR